MLVEDDNNLREIYEARLLAEGYEIVAAKDGEEALALAVKERPDLIISDVMMPKISGFDMLDILRSTAETKNTKVIMMTALSQAEDKARADKLGADRYLVKSQVTLEDVAKVASDVLNGDAAATSLPSSEPADETPQAAPAAPVSPPESFTAPAAVQPAEDATPAINEPVSPPAPVTEPTVQEPEPAPISTPVEEAETPEADNLATTPPVSEPAPAEVSTEPAPITDSEPAEEAPETPAPTPTESFGGISDDLNLSTADEKAAAEAQINEILSQTTPVDPANEPSIVTPPPPEPETPTPTPSLQQSAEAPVADLEVTSTPAEENETVTPEANPTVIPITVEEEVSDSAASFIETPVIEPTSLPSSAPATPPEAPVTNSVPINNKKVVIQPITDVAKAPDLNELLKREEAASAPAPAPTDVVTPGQSTAVNPDKAQSEPPVPPAQTGSVISPSDISL